MKLARIESREVYPVPERPHFIIHLGNGTVDFFLNGTEMPHDEIGNVIIKLVNAVNAAEKQIDLLFTVIQNAEIDPDEYVDYSEEYPKDEDYQFKYKVEDLKDALFHAMMRKDEKLIGKYINQINVLTEKKTIEG